MTTDPQALEELLHDLTSAEGGWWTLKTAKGAMAVVLTDALDKQHYDAVSDALAPAHERIQSAKRAIRKYVDDLRAERDEAIQAQKNQAAHLEHIAAGSIPAKNLRVGNFTTPRVITAEDLKEGQLVAIHRGHSWGVRAIGIFQEISDGKITLKMGDGKLFKESIKFHTIVLLADAPADQQEPEAEKLGYQKFYDSIGATDLLHRTPGPATVTAETIRASEPGSTWENSSGNVREVWDWNGKALIGRSTGRNSGPAFATRHWGPFTRSTAAPRGDYGKAFRMADWEREILDKQAAEKVKAELPTEPGEVILVTEFGGLYDAAEPIGAYRTNGNTWRRLDQEPWPGDYLGLSAPDEEITGWKPAKVVTDD